MESVQVATLVHDIGDEFTADAAARFKALDSSKKLTAHGKPVTSHEVSEESRGVWRIEMWLQECPDDAPANAHLFADELFYTKKTLSRYV